MSLSAELSQSKNSEPIGRLWRSRRLPKRRLVTFAGVGGMCLLLQLTILHLAITGLDISSRLDESLANAAAFMISTQINFWISRSTTWRDRRVPGTTLIARLKQQVAFNALAIGGLVINQVVFVLTSRHIGAVPASGIGTVAASGVTLVMSSIAVFPRAVRSPREAYDAIG